MFSINIESGCAYRLWRYVGLLILSAALLGCSADESAMICIEQSPGPAGINVSNQCNETVVVTTDIGEKLIIAAGLTHQLLRGGSELGVCFAPKEPQITEQGFRCE